MWVGEKKGFLSKENSVNRSRTFGKHEGSIKSINGKTKVRPDGRKSWNSVIEYELYSVSSLPGNVLALLGPGEQKQFGFVW